MNHSLKKYHFYALLLSILIHGLTLFKITKIKKKQFIIQEKITIYKLKVNKKRKKEKKKILFSNKISSKKSISFSDLSISKDYNPSHKSKEIGISGQIYFYNQINQYLSYPKEFVKFNIEGLAFVKVYYNKKGLKRLTIKSNNPFVRSYTSKIIESSITNSFLKKNARNKIEYAEMIFHFELTTDLSKKPILNNKQLYFYRKEYGGDSGLEKITKTTIKTLSLLSNIVQLLNYRPDILRTDSELIKRMLKEKEWGNLKKNYFFINETKIYRRRKD